MKSRRISMAGLLFECTGVALVLGVVAFAGCASQSDYYGGKVLHIDDRLTPEALSDQSLFIAPIVTPHGFDSAKAFSARLVADVLHETRPDFSIHYRKELDSLVGEENLDSLAPFYQHLWDADLLKLQTDEYAWKRVPANYALFIWMKNAGRVKDFNGIVRRKISLEAEIWSVKKMKVVWRAEASGFDPDAVTSDAQFIVKAIRKIFSLLPIYHPALHEDEW